MYEFRLHKENKKIVGASLKELSQRIEILPVSSAECERGISSQNLDATSMRNCLRISTLSDLVCIKVNGKSARDFDPSTYVEKWLKTGHHAACDAPTGKKKKVKEGPSALAAHLL
jgi:hypothetical protein